MSNHFIAINRGLDGLKLVDFTLATTSTTAADVELRIADVDGQGNVMTRLDVQKALRAIERLLADGNLLAKFPPL